MINLCVIRTPATERVNQRIDWQVKTAGEKPQVILFTLRVNGHPIYDNNTEAWYKQNNFAETWLFGEQYLSQFEQVLRILLKVEGGPICDFTEFNSPARRAVEVSEVKVVNHSTIFR